MKKFRTFSVFGMEVTCYRIEGLLRDQNMFGFYDCEKKLIGVDSGLRGAELEQTLIHELFHAALIRLHIEQQMPGEFAEVLIDNLARAVVDNYSLKMRK